MRDGRTEEPDRVEHEMTIVGVRASRAAELAWAVEFGFLIRKRLHGKFGRFGVHIDHVDTTR